MACARRFGFDLKVSWRAADSWVIYTIDLSLRQHCLYELENSKKCMR